MKQCNEQFINFMDFIRAWVVVDRYINTSKLLTFALSSKSH